MLYFCCASENKCAVFRLQFISNFHFVMLIESLKCFCEKKWAFTITVSYVCGYTGPTIQPAAGFHQLIANIKFIEKMLIISRKSLKKYVPDIWYGNIVPSWGLLTMHDTLRSQCTYFEQGISEVRKCESWSLWWFSCSMIIKIWLLKVLKYFGSPEPSPCLGILVRDNLWADTTRK